MCLDRKFIPSPVAALKLQRSVKCENVKRTTRGRDEQNRAQLMRLRYPYLYDVYKLCLQPPTELLKITIIQFYNDTLSRLLFTLLDRLAVMPAQLKRCPAPNLD